MSRPDRPLSPILLLRSVALLCLVLSGTTDSSAQDLTHESLNLHNARMQWWREARFGLFIHWGLYAVPAGEWNGKSTYGEWIRHSAQIPLDRYDAFVPQFNPRDFNARAWVRMAKDAGVSYIVITSKHHDGFCLFDSKYTDFDIMSTPFRRDVLKELADACREEGIRLCFYHSIMDWHHPDYLPRRDWEKDRTTTGADFGRYVSYMKNQLSELLTNYGPVGVLWFDGEWESTWNDSLGKDLYAYVRSLQPAIIVNNRVGAGRSGMEGFTEEGGFGGDFGTPEQEIPATGLPDVDWETCMTMNEHWGYNKSDVEYKSTQTLIRNLCDIASKGGNFLLNVGPTASGTFPDLSVERLRAIGAWMKVNGEAIYGAQASPFSSIPWGRCTQKPINGGTRLYLHVFDIPADGQLRLSGIYNDPVSATLLGSTDPVAVHRDGNALVVQCTNTPTDSLPVVIALDIQGAPDIDIPPRINAPFDIFIDSARVLLESDRRNISIRYTLDGSEPSGVSPLYNGPVYLRSSLTIAARCFRDGLPVSPVSRRTFTRTAPASGVDLKTPQQGLRYAYYEGTWDSLPGFGTLRPVKEGWCPEFDLSLRRQRDHFALVFTGYLHIPETGVYGFALDSDDGSRLYINDVLAVDNNGLHGRLKKEGVLSLAKGYHNIRVEYFEKDGNDALTVSVRTAAGKFVQIPQDFLFSDR